MEKKMDKTMQNTVENLIENSAPSVKDKEAILAALRGHLNSFVNTIFEEIPTISSNTHFCELGATSCDQAVIVADTLNTLSIKFPIERALLANNVGDLVDVIYEHSNKNSEKGMFILQKESQSRVNESICSI